MGLLSVFSVVDKILPGRKERLRNRVQHLERRKDELRKSGLRTDSDIRRYNRVIHQLSELKNKSLQQ